MRRGDVITMEMPVIPGVRHRPDPRRLLAPVLLFVLFGVMLISLASGAFELSPSTIAAILAGEIGWSTPWTYTEREALVLLQLRAPRVLAGVLTGAIQGHRSCGLTSNR
jgi:ABC-type Fe3+-siderophore transport system permease subunit